MSFTQISSFRQHYRCGCISSDLVAISDPKSLAEARSRPDWHCWEGAMDREIATLEKVGTWNTAPSRRYRAGENMWVYPVGPGRFHCSTAVYGYHIPAWW
jgi:hypothetical protein